MNPRVAMLNEYERRENENARGRLDDELRTF